VRSPRSPALAIAWQFRLRHRLGLLGLAGYLTVLAIAKLMAVELGWRINLDSPESFALVVVVPLTATFTYFLAVFTFGLEGDLAARRSMYPSRLFTLPVTTSALVGWPMLYGSAAMTVLWFATRLFAMWPSGVDVPWIWPALAAASLLAWTQALTWMSYGLPGLRAIVTVLWLAVIDAVVLLALHFKAPEHVMLAILAPHVPLAYLTARLAVGRARRGEVRDWRGLFTGLERTADAPSIRRMPFPSPARAQFWFEWRRFGPSLPALVLILLPFELALLSAAGNTPLLVLEILLGVLCTPPLMASFVAATVSRSNADASDSPGVTPFTATRPSTTAALIAAKLKAAMGSTIAAWLLVVVAIPLGLALSGTAPMVIDRARRIHAVVGTPHAIGFVLLGLTGFILWTWKQLVNGLYVGLSGRDWVVRGSVYLTLSFLAALGPVAQWIAGDRSVQIALWNAIPLLLGALVCGKMLAAAWVIVRLYRSGLLADRTLVTSAACWAVVVLVLYGLLTWLFFTPFLPRYLLGLATILVIPLVRLSAAPLAFAWNRHR
jgi:hypothetical protein